MYIQKIKEKKKSSVNLLWIIFSIEHSCYIQHTVHAKAKYISACIFVMRPKYIIFA